MENLNTSFTNKEEAKPPSFTFFGKGSTFFGIVALNLILTLVTFGFYYPWAKAAYRKYIWNEVEIKDSRFVFNGTGKEMFIGFLIVYGILGGYYISLSFAAAHTVARYFLLIFVLMFILLIPFALFGAWRYRVTRTSWRGVFMSFNGNFGEFLKLFLVQAVFTLFTLGIYFPWMRVKLQKYLFSHTKIGNLKMDFHGYGSDLFGIIIIGIILTPLTLYMYVPIFIKERFNFTINHTTLQDEERRVPLTSTLENGEAWSTLMVNALLLLFTLGLAYPWTFMRSLKMYLENINLPEEFDYDNLTQAEGDFKNASGDELLDMFDMGIDF